MTLAIQDYTPDGLLVKDPVWKDDTITMDLTGTAGSVTDTTAYPVATQATKTEKITVDAGAEQTVTFTTAIDQATVTDTTTYPVADQTGNTEKVTVDGGSEQTVTFGTATTAQHVADQMDAQLQDCSVAVVAGQVKITSDTTGASSTVTIGTGTCALAWAAPGDQNSAADITSEINAQITGAYAAVAAGQVIITSDSTGLTSTVAIGTGTADLTWAAAVAGTGQTGTLARGTILARNTSSKKLTAYSDAGSTGENEPVAVLTAELVFASSGDKAARVAVAGVVSEGDLVKHDDATAIDTLVYDKLRKNSGIVPVTVTDLSAYDNYN
jgi:hypothetical protein